MLALRGQSLASHFYVLTFFGPFSVSKIARSTRDPVSGRKTCGVTVPTSRIGAYGDTSRNGAEMPRATFGAGRRRGQARLINFLRRGLGFPHSATCEHFFRAYVSPLKSYPYSFLKESTFAIFTNQTIISHDPNACASCLGPRGGLA